MTGDHGAWRRAQWCTTMGSADRLFRVTVGVGRVLVLARDATAAEGLARDAACEYMDEEAYTVPVALIELPTRGDEQVLDVDWT